MRVDGGCSLPDFTEGTGPTVIVVGIASVTLPGVSTNTVLVILGQTITLLPISCGGRVTSIRSFEPKAPRGYRQPEAADY